MPPACLGCGAVERHRIIHDIYKALAPWTRHLRALQLMPDKTLPAEQFETLVTLPFRGEKAPDLMNSGLPAERYDLIIANHVLSYVRDDSIAIQELLRVVGDKGAVHLCVPSPSKVPKTIDWGFPDPTNGNQYRVYGADAARRWLLQSNNFRLVLVLGRDAVTGRYESVFWLTRGETIAYQLVHTLLAAGFAAVTAR